MKKLLALFLLLFCFYGVSYAADTITVMDGITNAQTAADSDFYTIDTAGFSAVGMYNVNIPVSAVRLRVVYNNNKDAAGSTVYIRSRISKTTDITTPTKSVAEVDAMQEIAQAAILEGTTVDVSGIQDGILHIDCALSSTTAQANGTEIIVQVSSNTTGDANWTNLTSFGGPTGTAINVGLGGDEAAGQTILTVTNPVTSNLDLLGKWLFLENTATPANSEFVYQTAQSGD